MLDVKRIDLHEKDHEDVFREWKLQEHSYSKDLRILNYTARTVYVSNGLEIIPIRPLMTTLRHDKASSYVEVRLMITERNLDHIPYENRCKNDKTYEPQCFSHQFMYSDLANDVLFSEDLNLTIGFDQEETHRRHPGNPETIEKRIEDAVAVVRNSQESCPIKIEINDPMKRIDKIYLVWGGNISRHPVCHSDLLGEVFRIHRVNHLGQVLSEDYNLSDFLKQKSGLDLEPGDVFITENIQQATHKQYVFREGPENNRVAALKSEYDRLLAKTNQKLDDALVELNRYKELEIQRIRARHDQMKYEVAEKKMETSLKSDELNQESEKMKFEKEKSSNEASQTSDVLKIVGAGIALATAIIIAVVKLSSSKSLAPVVALSAPPLAAVVGVMAVGSLMASTAKSVWRSVTSWF